MVYFWNDKYIVYRLMKITPDFTTKPKQITLNLNVAAGHLQFPLIIVKFPQLSRYTTRELEILY